MPGACAPSATISAPRSCASRARALMGVIRPVPVVIWLHKTSLVRFVNSRSKTFRISSGHSGRMGIWARLTTAPRRRSARCRQLSIAPYSWFDARISSPGHQSSPCTAMLMAIVTLAAKAISSAGALIKAPRRARASSTTPEYFPRCRVGLRSTSSRISSIFSNTGLGCEPKEPVLR